MGVLGLRIAGAAEHQEMGLRDVAESPGELLESVWNDTATELLRLALALGLPADRVDDVLQDVYLTSLQKTPQGIDRDELRLWLIRVTVNRCHLEHRRGRRWRAVWNQLALFRSAGAAADAELGRGHDEQRRVVAECLKTLDPRLRTALVLRYFQDLNSKQIGRILDLPDSTVRSLLRTARQRLATALKRMGYDDTTCL